MDNLKRKCSILLVEDNCDDVELIKRTLSELDNPVVVAQDGQEALDYLQGRGRFSNRDPEERPCLILLDLKLPKIDGLDLLREIRSNDRTHMVPVVIMTASDAEHDMLSSYRHGANSYVKKPLKREEFAKVISLIGLYWTFIAVRPPMS